MSKRGVLGALVFGSACEGSRDFTLWTPAPFFHSATRVRSCAPIRSSAPSLFPPALRSSSSSRREESSFVGDSFGALRQQVSQKVEVEEDEQSQKQIADFLSLRCASCVCPRPLDLVCPSGGPAQFSQEGCCPICRDEVSGEAVELHSVSKDVKLPPKHKDDEVDTELEILHREDARLAREGQKTLAKKRAVSRVLAVAANVGSTYLRVPYADGFKVGDMYQITK